MIELGIGADIKAPVIKDRTVARWDLYEPFIKAIILFTGLAVIFYAIQSGAMFNWEFQQALRDKSPVFRWVFLINVAVFLASLIIRTFLWFKYRPYNSAAVEEWPAVTVVVPAYNEGETVYETIRSIANADYPEGKIKIVAIDDGSRDDTYSYMVRARDEFPELVKLVKFEKNRGKRDGICEGFRNCNDEIFITIDSDTLLQRDSIKELVTPLLLDSSLGAVTGRIKIWNADANIMTKMLKTNFAMAFDFSRAIQSTFNTVFCTSGAFSAYRSSIMAQILEPWRKQKFLGVECTYGEDRALANYILETGAGTVYQQTAVAFTKVPEKFINIMKMLVRWTRSNIRESFVFSAIMFNEKRKGNYWLPFFEFFATVAIIFLQVLLFYYLVGAGFVDGQFLIRTVAYSILFGFFYMLYYIRIEGVKEFPYVIGFSIFCSIFMMWIFTYSGLTLTKKHWSTR